MSVRRRSWFIPIVAFCLLHDCPSLADDLAASPAPPPLFEELPAEAMGVEFVNRLLPEHPLAYLYHSGYQCGGVCVGDVNGDGRPDLFFVNGPDENALFLNRGGMRFEKSAASAQLAGGDAWGVGASLADVDGDGDLDLFVCNYATPSRLWLNQGNDKEGNPQFAEAASAAGLAYEGPSLCPYFADFDVDGDLDLFLLTNRLYSPTGRPNEVASELGADGQPRVKEKYAPYLRVVDPASEVPGGEKTPGKFLLEYGYEDRLYRNDGIAADGIPHFTDVTAGSGLAGVAGHGLSALIWDVNHDDRPDIYVANDYTDPDRLWINQGPDENGVVRFRDAADEFLPYTTWFSMGSDVADINGDGRLDFMVADMAATTHYKAKTTMGEMNGWRRWVLENAWPRQVMRNMLFVDAGIGRFRETAFIAGVASTDWTWAVKFADFDLDGRNDLFLTNGTARVFSDSDILVEPEMLIGKTEWDVFRDAPEMREKNLAFKNLDGQQFQNQSAPWNVGKEGMSYGAATGDLDGDGDLDLIVCNLTENVSIYRNRATESGSSWLRVRLEDPVGRVSNPSTSPGRVGSPSYRSVYGALVTLTLDDGSQQVRLANPQTGFLSMNEPVLHFGLGDGRSIESLTVRWPDGAEQKLAAPAPNQLLVVRRSEEARREPSPPRTPPRFVERASELGLEFTHHEIPFDDFQREFLLPGKLSQFGPGLAVADVNGDGADDVFVGGAAGQAATLFVSAWGGSLDRTTAQSGSVERPAPAHFRPLENAPWLDDAEREDMGVLFFDADRDGDFDLYVARGSNQWYAGHAYYQDSLYLNVTEPGGEVRFEKAPEDALPLLRESASCVVGCDFDLDGDVDLFVGARSIPGSFPLTPRSSLLVNESTGPDHVRFREATDEVAAGLARVGLVTGGLWSDVDGDGWSDLLVTCEWGSVRLFKNERGKLADATASTALAERTGWWNGITGADVDNDGDIDYIAANVGLNTKYGHATNEKPALLYRGDMDANGRFDLVEAKCSADGELPVRGRSCSSTAMPLLKEKFPTYKAFAAASLTDIYGPTTLGSSERWAANEFESGVWINNSTEGSIQLRWQPLPLEAQVSPCFGVIAADLFGGGSPSLAMVQNLFSREPETGLWRGGLGCIFQMGSGVLSPGGHEQGKPTALPSRRSGFVVAGDGKALAVADVNADGRPDLVATQNNGPLLAFEQQAQTQDSPLVAVRLAGPPGNPAGCGARVKLLVDDQVVASAEVHGGSGYLSQSASTVYFRRPVDENSARMVVEWPGGNVTTAGLSPDQATVVVPAP